LDSLGRHYFHNCGFVWKTLLYQLWICMKDINSTVVDLYRIHYVH
jgi:hypothetical protein